MRISGWIVPFGVALVTAVSVAPVVASQLSPGVPAHREPLAASDLENARALFKALLEGSGVPTADWARYERKFDTFAAELRTLTRGVDARERAKILHMFLHRRILRGGFQTSASNLGHVLDGGVFNCATASALFLVFAMEIDLPSQCVSSPGHVWCRVATPQGSLDVETTCPGWFELIAPEPPAAMGTAAQLSADQILASHRQRAAAARLLDRKAFVAVFHYNQGVQLLKNGEFKAALQANQTALALDPHCTLARDNLLATINDWALALAAQGQRGAGLDLLGKGLAMAPDYQPFRTNYGFIARQAEGLQAISLSTTSVGISSEHGDLSGEN